MLNGDWSGQTLLESTVSELFMIGCGYLIIDDTVIEKPYSSALNEASWVRSSKNKKTVFGISVVVLIWTDGQIRIPLSFRVWKKHGQTQTELALELLSYARNELKLKPQFVLFDSWYASKRILKRISDYGWYFVSQLKKNRNFQSVPLKNYLRQPYWNDRGFLNGGIKVFVVKHRRKYYASNRLSLTPTELRTIYRVRQQIEEVFKSLKSSLGLEKCQAGYQRTSTKKAVARQGAQEHHTALCLTAFVIIERERVDNQKTWQELRTDLILVREEYPLPSLTRLSEGA